MKPAPREIQDQDRLPMRDYILTSPAFSGPRPPLWGVFDAVWYRARYGRRLSQEYAEEIGKESSDTPASPDDEWLARHWRERGARAGLSPNRFFDEVWYLRENEDVRNGVKRDGIFDSGFLHYCESGFRSRTPHWLFSEGNYFEENPDLTPHTVSKAGFSNGYDHYLRIGDHEKRIAHPFFDPALFQAQCLSARLPYNHIGSGFSQFLQGGDYAALRCSWYFDPAWYLERYPDVRAALEQGRFSSPLHHYLTNDSPGDFDPNPWFSEAHYRAFAPDVAAIIANGGFRNGYEHFVRFGAKERRSPHPEVDLNAIALLPEIVRILREGRARDAFVCWIQHQAQPVRAEETPAATPGQYRVLDMSRTRTLLPAAIRAPFSFRPWNTPEISIVILTHNVFHDLMATLCSLQANNPQRMEVIVVDTGSTDETRDLERLTHGLVILRPGRHTPRSEQRRLAALKASAGSILFMEAGVQLFPGVLDPAVNVFQQSGASALGGQLLSLDGHVHEAGSIVWRDGKTTAYGRGLEANAPEISFRRIVDAIAGGLLLCDKQCFVDCEGSSLSAGHDPGGFVALCLALRQNGGKIIYEPSVLARTPESDSAATNAGSLHLRKTFGALLSRQHLAYVPIARARSANREPSVLIVCERAPWRCEGGQARRTQALIRNLASSGHQVTVFALDETSSANFLQPLELSPTVEFMFGRTLATLENFLKDRSGCFDAVWLQGSTVLQRTASILQTSAEYLPTNGLILDTGVLHALEAHYRRLVGCRNDETLLLKEAASELNDAWMCQALVATNDDEAKLLEQLGYPNVHILGHAVAPLDDISIPGFDEREGLIFILPIASAGDAVHDGLDWFFQNTMRKLDSLLPKDATLLLAGYRGEGVSFAAYGRHSRIEGIPETIDLKRALRQRRVMIAPTRVTGGQPEEVFLAAASGLPSVVGDNLAHQLGWTADDACLNGGTSDADRFANAVARLYLDKELWKKLSAKGRRKTCKQASEADFQKTIQKIMESSLNPVSLGNLAPPSHESATAEPVFAPAPLNLRPRASIAPSSAVKDEDISEPSTLAPRLGVSFT